MITKTSAIAPAVVAAAYALIRFTRCLLGYEVKTLTVQRYEETREQTR